MSTKDTRAKIQQLKKAINSAPKEKRKELQAEIKMLEESLSQQTGQENSAPLVVSLYGPEKPTFISKQQQRKDRKEKQAAEDYEAALKEAAGKRDFKREEDDLFEEMLLKAGLSLYLIPADGNCLYNSISHQMSLHSVQVDASTLRQEVSEYLSQNSETFMPFALEEDTGECMSIEKYIRLCESIKQDGVWGGNLEIQAIAEKYKTHIIIYQADSVLNIGEHFGSQPLRISYHKHTYMLGSHYNSIITRG